MEPAARARVQGVFAMLLNGATLEDLLALLPTPTENIGFIRSRSGVAGLTGLEYDLVSRREHIDLGRYCTQLGYDQSLVGGIIDLVCQETAHSIRRAMILDARSPQPVMAVSIYMGSHLLCVGTSIKRISEVIGVSERTIRTAYGSVYPRRAELVESRFFDCVPCQNATSSGVASSYLVYDSRGQWDERCGHYLPFSSPYSWVGDS